MVRRSDEDFVLLFVRIRMDVGACPAKRACGGSPVEETAISPSQSRVGYVSALGISEPDISTTGLSGARIFFFIRFL